MKLVPHETVILENPSVGNFSFKFLKMAICTFSYVSSFFIKINTFLSVCKENSIFCLLEKCILIWVVKTISNPWLKVKLMKTIYYILLSLFVLSVPTIWPKFEVSLDRSCPMRMNMMELRTYKKLLIEISLVIWFE